MIKLNKYVFNECLVPGTQSLEIKMACKQGVHILPRAWPHPAQVSLDLEVQNVSSYSYDGSLKNSIHWDGLPQLPHLSDEKLWVRLKQLLALGDCGMFALAYSLPSKWNAFLLFSAQPSISSSEAIPFPSQLVSHPFFRLFITLSLAHWYTHHNYWTTGLCVHLSQDFEVPKNRWFLISMALSKITQWTFDKCYQKQVKEGTNEH